MLRRALEAVHPGPGSMRPMFRQKAREGLLSAPSSCQAGPPTCLGRPERSLSAIVTNSNRKDVHVYYKIGYGFVGAVRLHVWPRLAAYPDVPPSSDLSGRFHASDCPRRRHRLADPVQG